MTDSFAEDQSSVLSFRAKIWEMTYALRSFAVSMNWSSINCTTALMIEQSSLYNLGVKVLNMKMDFNIYGTWSRVG